MTSPRSPIEAVTHPNPYPYYRDLVEGKPFGRDEALGIWVAASAAAVTAALESPLCRVRPSAEPVPAALAASAAGDVFGRLVRFTDGERHGPIKRAVAEALDALEPARVRAVARERAAALVERLDPIATAGRLTALAFAMPAEVTAALLGVPRELLEDTAALVGDFAGCLAPGAAPERTARGGVAAARLLELLGTVDAPEGLLGGLRHAAQRQRADEAVVVANAVGFLSQSYEVTAGLIGNALVALARHPDARRRVAADPTLVALALEEVLRHDPPVQNTRRFVARDGELAGRAVAVGDTVLVVLAAANRDPALVAEPDRFDLDRADRRQLTLGAGTHACPGGALALAIAEAAVARLLANGLDLEPLATPVGYRPSANTRIPVFGEEVDG